MTRRIRALVAAAFLAALPALAGAQTSQTGTLQGTVTTSDGRPVANATVTIRQADGSYPRGTQTGDRGDYRINFIVPGTYEVTVRLIGFRPVVYRAVVIRASAVQRIDASLERAPVELTTIAVEADPVVINTVNTEFTSNLNVKERELLPAARDANALISFTPGARPGQIFGGSTGQANLYQLDGVMVNQPGFGGSFLLPNVDWIEDFQVIGLGAGAEYGNFQGGLVNIVTKSGSNTLQGQVRTFFESRLLNYRDPNAFEAGSRLDQQPEINAELRGPLIRDRLYFYVSGQERRRTDEVVDLATSAAGDVSYLGTRESRNERKYYAKLTWQATDADIVNASLGYDNVDRERAGLSSFDAIDATYRGRSPSTFYQLNWQRTISNSQSLEVKFSGYNGEDNEFPYNGSNVPAVVLLDQPNSPQFNNSFYTRRNAPASYGFTAKYDAYFNTGDWQHNLKVGGEYTFGTWRERRTRNGGLTWYTEPGQNFDPQNPATWTEIPSIGFGVYATTDTGGRIDLAADTRNGAVYVQDYVRINDRLSINGGLRLSQWAGYITPGNGGGSRGPDKFRAVNATGIDPRIGATLDITGDGGLVAKAHWGRFHQNLFALFFDRAPGANVFTNIEFCDWNNTDGTQLPEINRPYTGEEFAANFTCFPGNSLFNEASAFEDYEQPYVDQITLGLEKSLGRNLKAGVVYINRVNKAVLSLVDRNIGSNWSPIENVAVLDSRGPVLDPDGNPLVLPRVFVRNDNLRSRLRAGDEIPGYTAADTARLTFEQDLVIRPVDEARRTFDQVQLTLEGAYEAWRFNAALAWTDLRGNLFSVNGYFNPSGQENGPFVEPNLQANYDGRLPNYSPWDFKLRASGQLPWGFEGGAFLTWTSGDFWTPTLNIDRRRVFFDAQSAGGPVELAGSLFAGANGQAVLTEPRGSRQFDALTQLDLRLQKVLAIGGQDLIVGAEVFNVFNRDVITVRKESLNNQDPDDPSSLVGAVRFRQQPTTFRLNLQYRF